MPVTLIGQGGLRTDFEAVGVAVRGKMQADLHQGLQVAYQTAFANAPVDTGFLRGSMSGTVIGNQASLFAPARYAGFQEYGTVRNRPQPYWRPAARDAINYYHSQGYRLA